MADFRIDGISSAQNSLPAKPAATPAEGGFDSILSEAMGTVSALQNEAEQAIQNLAAGGDVAQAVIAMEKADLSFQVMVEVRNKLLTAYEEIMRMQI